VEAKVAKGPRPGGAGGARGAAGDPPPPPVRGTRPGARANGLAVMLCAVGPVASEAFLSTDNRELVGFGLTELLDRVAGQPCRSRSLFLFLMKKAMFLCIVTRHHCKLLAAASPTIQKFLVVPRGKKIKRRVVLLAVICVHMAPRGSVTVPVPLDPPPAGSAKSGNEA
jgi:hypothetical protein